MPRIFGIIPENIEVVSGIGILTTKDEITVEDINIFSVDNVVITVAPNKDALPDTFYRVNILVDNFVSRVTQIAWSASDIASGKRFRIPVRNVGRLGDDYVVSITRDTARPVSNVIISDGSGLVGNIIDIPVLVETVPNVGLAGYILEFIIDSDVIGFSDVTFPPEFGLSSHRPAILTGKERKVQASGTDLSDTITGGELNVLICILQVRGNRVGRAVIEAIGLRMDDDSGFPIATTFKIGTVNIT